jgi:primosomal protein N' (replication factor Y)
MSLFGPAAGAPPADAARSSIPAPRRARYATVALDRATSFVDKELTYLVPPSLQDELEVGFAVLVPVGRQSVTGYVTGFTGELDFDAAQLKPISQTLSRAPLFDPIMLRLMRWLASYYHCPLSECLACCVPHGWQVSGERRYALAEKNLRVLRDLVRAPRQLQIAQLLMAGETALSAATLAKQLGEATAPVNATLARLVEQGVVVAVEELPTATVRPRRVQAVRVRAEKLQAADWPQEWDALQKRAPRQAAALEQLKAMREEDDTPIPAAQLARDYGIEAGVLRALEKKGLLEYSWLEQARRPGEHLPSPDAGRVVLSAEQQVAVEAIVNALRAAGSGVRVPGSDSGEEQPPAPQSTPAHPENHANPGTRNPEPGTLLLQGVTASGKTEVYLHAIEQCLEMGRRALVLVPEIALTAQTVEIFQRRFQEKVAILHSALGAGERFDEWRRVRAGQADIVVGARSAVFAPVRNLGLIVLDEEHDHSYKQDATPRYHARDVVLKRAALEGAVVVLGSATPSLESYAKARRGEFGHLHLTRRVAERPLPAVEIVDMTDEARAGVLPVLSRRLKDELLATVARGEQVIIFLNRRGFATYVQCLGCGHVERCPDCDVSLTFHKGARELRCHHCGFLKPVVESCPECQGWMIGFTGTGTEKVETDVRAVLAKSGLAETNILRLDRDTTGQKGAHARILNQFRRGQAQVLIGTQMVTKGLDFPGVTLVGVISADAALNVPDFRAAERTFQLLSQVAGRAGRGDKAGQVLVQTLTTDHYAILAAQRHDYAAFVLEEGRMRREPAYPPFSHIVNVIAQDAEEGRAKARIQNLAIQFAEAIGREGGGTELLGPVDCPLSRLKGKYRFHLMLRDRNRPRLHRVLRVYDDLPREGKEGLTVDVDAMTIL